MEKLIESGNELVEYFRIEYKRLSNRVGKRSEVMLKGIFVDGRVRKDLLISTEQGRYTQDGEFFNVEFESSGGGVYRAFVRIGGDK